MNILIVYNAQKDFGASIAKKASKILEDCGAHVNIMQFSAEMTASDREYEKSQMSASDVIAVIGGDGTILKTAKSAALLNRPVLGINAGRLGYLASVGSDNLEILKRLTDGDYSVENRAMLKAEKYGDGVCGDSCNCLNDAVISKDALSNVIDIKLCIGNDTVQYRADGIIAATPTGSTAYSLSAGGPVVDPTLECMILTPVCPHTLVTRSVVLDFSTPVSISVKGGDGTEVYLSCDGRKAFELNSGTTVTLSISELHAKFIKLNNVSVYKIFSEKTGKY